MARLTIPTLTALLVLTAAPARAQDGKAEKPPDLLGFWTHKAEEGKVTLDICQHTLICTIEAPKGMAFTVEADYAVSPDGLLVGILRAKQKKKDADNPDERVFCCRLSRHGGTLTVHEMKCGLAEEQVKKFVEGTYKLDQGRKAATVRPPASATPAGAPILPPPCVPGVPPVGAACPVPAPPSGPVAPVQVPTLPPPPPATVPVPPVSVIGPARCPVVVPPAAPESLLGAIGALVGRMGSSTVIAPQPALPAATYHQHPPQFVPPTPVAPQGCTALPCPSGFCPSSQLVAPPAQTCPLPPQPATPRATTPPAAAPAPKKKPSEKLTTGSVAETIGGWLGSVLGGGYIEVYSSDPNQRIQQLINNSEDLHVIQQEWERFWCEDHPSHLTPERSSSSGPRQ